MVWVWVPFCSDRAHLIGIGLRRPSMENELCDVVDAIAALVWTMRPDGQADFVNQRWREYTGLSVEEARGSGWKATIADADLPGVLDYCGLLQEAGEPGAIEARMRRFDGTHRWFL